MPQPDRLPPAANRLSIRCRVLPRVRWLLLVLFLFSKAASAGIADRIAAFVGDEPILESQVAAGMDFLRLQTALTDTVPVPDSVLRHQVLEQLISDQVILEQARRETLNVTKEQVDAELENNIKRLKSRFKDPDSFSLMLAAEGLTESQLRQRLREEITRRLTAQQLLAKHNLIENITVAPTEVRDFYATHKDSLGTIPGRIKLAHILLMVRPDTVREKKAYEQIVQAYIGLVQNNWDFEALAGSFTTDEALREKSGFLGNVARGDLPEEVDSVLFSLKAGSFSQPFRARTGWIIIKREKGTGDRATAREILVGVPITRADTNRMLSFADELRRRALAGEDFGTLARTYSDDPMSRNYGGELGEFFIKGLAEPYAAKISALKTGEISAPFITPNGVEIVKVLERIDEQVPTYDEVQDEIRNYLYEKKLKAKLDDYVKTLSARIFIQRF